MSVLGSVTGYNGNNPITLCSHLHWRVTKKYFTCKQCGLRKKR